METSRRSTQQIIHKTGIRSVPKDMTEKVEKIFSVNVTSIVQQ